jgi:hypothetical protein
MATRSQVGFYKSGETQLDNWDALIYRHWDGYPEAVLPELMPILNDFNKSRGLDDTEYASAWLVAQWKKDMLNIGISKWFHGDLDFFYAVYPDKVDVYAVTGLDADFSKKQGLKLVKTVKIKGERK